MTRALTGTGLIAWQWQRAEAHLIRVEEEWARADKDFREFYERLRILRRERDGGMEQLLMAMATGYDYRKYQRVKALEKKRSSS